MSKEQSPTVRVVIGGIEHPIKADAPKEYIQRIAKLVDKQITDVQRRNPNLTGQRTAILVALNLANELEKLREEYKELLAIIEEAQ